MLVSVNTSLMFAYFLSIYLFQRVPSYKQYTSYNLTLLLLSFIVQHPYLNAVVFTNSMAICISFHSSLLFDRTAFQRLIQASNGTSSLQWHIMNGIGHIAPVWMTYFRPMVISNNILTPGTVSCLFHLTWAFVRHRGLILNDSYISLPAMIWYALWCIAISTHFLSDLVLMNKN
jgi:hypothetical protein